MAVNISQSAGLDQSSSLSRWANATGITATEDDIFVSCPMLTGFGYGIWRLDHNLENVKVIMDDVHGCCGQLDIQTEGENLLVAENTKFQVGFYDRDGKRLNGWGKRSRNDDEGFGSCCNPMNVRCCSNGDILTAESSIGHIKRFHQAGEYLGFIGTAKIAGGCKHVAIGFDPKRDWHYMMNEDRSHVAVLVPKKDAPAESEAVTGSPEQAAQMIESSSSKWQAIQARDGKLDFVTLNEGVQGFGATVEFMKDDTAKFVFFYGVPSSPIGGSFVFKRIALEACGQDCKAACADGNSEKGKPTILVH